MLCLIVSSDNVDLREIRFLFVKIIFLWMGRVRKP